MVFNPQSVTPVRLKKLMRVEIIVIIKKIQEQKLGYGSIYHTNQFGNLFEQKHVIKRLFSLY